MFDTSAARMAQAAGSPNIDDAAIAEAAVEVSLETREHGGEGGLDLSASQRLKTVRALNANVHPSLREPDGMMPPVSKSEPHAPVATPESIEDQINTSITQTLKALNVCPPVSAHEPVSRPSAEHDDDDEDENTGGFFSRFRRS